MFAPKSRVKALLSIVLAASLSFGAPAAFAAQQANGDPTALFDATDAVEAQATEGGSEAAASTDAATQATDESTASGDVSLASSASTIADEQNLSSLANSENAWQVVSEGYTGNGTNNKTASYDGNVAVQKNVVPTGTENEFLVYLSIDYKAALKNYFENAEYQATEANKNHGVEVGQVVSSMEGAKDVSVASGNIYSRSGKFTVVDPGGNTIAQNVTISWSKANNVTFYLKVDDSHYVLFGTGVRDGGTNNVALSAEAWELIRQEAVKTALNQVTDTMGDNIEYVETVASDGTTDYNSGSKTLTWTPEVKADCKTESSTSGNETTTWYRNAAELVYKVKLTPPRSTGLTDSSGSLSPASSDDAICAVNSKATLTYNSTAKVDFPVPKVKGLLYDLVFTKVAEGTDEPLQGATFKLQQQDEDSAWQDVSDSSGNVITATSDENGQVAFTDLQHGTYRAVETQAPTGYKNTDANGKALTWEPSTLCWTTNSKDLVQSTVASENAMAVESANATVANTRSMGLMVLKVDRDNNPLSGVTFTLTSNDGSTTSAVSAVTEPKTVKKGNASASESVAAASFATLSSGTYTLTESRVVAGYEISSQSPYTIAVSASGVTVSDSSGQPVALNTLTYEGETYYYLTVTNKSLQRLPEAGGAGRLCAYAAGTAALLLGLRQITRRRGRHAAKR